MRQRTLELRQATADRAHAFFGAGPLRRGLYALWHGLRRHHVSRAASAMAFNLFLAAIPMMAFAGWLIAQVLRQSPEALSSMSLLLDLTPTEMHNIILRHVGRFSAGAVAPIALAGTLWLAASAFHTLMSVFETMVHARRRPWWRKRLIAMGCVVGTVGMFAATGAIAVLAAGGPGAILDRIEAGQSFGPPLGHALALSVLLLGATTGLAGFFRIAVKRPGVRRRVWGGAFMTMGIGGSASYLFVVYAKELARFALFYGGLAAVAIALFWLWIWCAALLVGAELNAQLEGREDRPPSRVLP